MALQQYSIQKVVSSPYLRCLATASRVCHALSPGIAQVEIDYSLSEVEQASPQGSRCSSLFLGLCRSTFIVQIAARPYFVGEGPTDGQAFQDWMWGGETPEESWKLGLGATHAPVHVSCTSSLETEAVVCLPFVQAFVFV